jgi:WD40 repeat protein
VVAVATAQLDGRPVVVSGGVDATVRVWDLATGQPVGSPFTGHTHIVYAVTTAQLDGRPIAVSGSYDKTVRVWDLATRAHS